MKVGEKWWQEGVVKSMKQGVERQAQTQRRKQKTLLLILLLRNGVGIDSLWSYQIET